MIPKVGCAADVYAVDALVTAIERAKGRDQADRLRGDHRKCRRHRPCRGDRRSSPRLQAMSLGAADFAASMGMQTTGIGGTQENYYMAHEGAKYWSDPWHWAQAAIVAACRTHGVLPVDGPFGDFSDDEGFRAQARRSATLGMVGKWAIHPKQIALANEVFTPSEARLPRRARSSPRWRKAKAEGAGRDGLQGAAGRYRLDQTGRGDRAAVRDDRGGPEGFAPRARPASRCLRRGYLDETMKGWSSAPSSASISARSIAAASRVRCRVWSRKSRRSRSQSGPRRSGRCRATRLPQSRR